MDLDSGSATFNNENQEDDKVSIEYCTRGHDGEPPASLMGHFANNKYTHDSDKSIEAEISVGLRFEGLGVESSVVQSAKFKVNHKLTAEVVMAYHAPNNDGAHYPMPAIFLKDNPAQVFNYWLDPRDVFVAKCTYALSVSTDQSTKEQLKVMGNGAASTQGELDTVTRSISIPVRLNKGDTLDAINRACDDNYINTSKNTLEQELNSEIERKFLWRQNNGACPWVDETGYLWLIPNCDVNCTAANEANLNCARLRWTLGQEGEPLGPGKGRYRCEKDICLHKIGP